jgi:DNA-binding FadR family transcriptional regulator
VASQVAGRVRIPKTSEVIARQLRHEIVSGQIAEGAPLPTEPELIDRFGVSRPSIREAFRVLESEQLIMVLRGSHGGARAMRPDVSVAARYLAVLMQYNEVPLSDVFMARALIEPMAFRLLAGRRNRAKRAAELIAILDQIGAETSRRDEAAVWVDFYTRLFEASGNMTLSLLYGTLTEVLRYELLDSIPESHARREYAAARDTLKRVLDMAVQGDGEAAAELWTNVMLRSARTVSQKHKDKIVDASNGNGG